MRKLSMLALLLIVMSSAFAGEKGDIKVINDSSAVFRVYYSKPEANKVKVTIYNEEGDKVFAETIKNKDGFVRPYNMKELPTGLYTFEITDNEGAKRFEYNYGDDSFRKSNSSDLLVSVKKLDTERFLLALGNADNEEVEINVYNDRDELLYSATEFVENQFAQLYNLKSVKSSKLTFTILNKTGAVEEFIF